jgi:exopolysaccharide biosynthesis polyprenyl glycosylphosphotransferase
MLCAVLALLLLPAFAWSLPWVPGIKLENAVRLSPYAMAVFVGLIWARRGLFAKEIELHRMSWSAAWSAAARQSAIVALCIFTLMFVIKDRGISRLFLGAYLLLLCSLLACLHAGLPVLLARCLFPERDVSPTLLLARGGNLRALDDWIASRRHLGLVPVGYLGDRGPPSQAGPCLGDWDKLAETIEVYGAVQVILLGWLDDPDQVERMVRICESSGCRFLIHNDYGARYARRFVALEEAGHDFLAVQMEPLEDPFNRVLKRVFDIVISLPVVVLILPPACVLVWLVQLLQARGPLFFRMPRSGWRKRSFPMLKFRSMYADNLDVNSQAKASDSRVYPWGRILRRTSLDELPQFWNVLKGEMSVVGPRPHLVSHDDEFSKLAPGYRIRSLVKPGITGLAQVKGLRGEINDAEKLRQRVYWDLYYVRNWSLTGDFGIVLRTAWQIWFPPPSAY